MPQHTDPFEITQTMADIFASNVGVVITPNELDAVLTPNRMVFVRGCIERLYYGSGDEDLDFIIVDGRLVRAKNLKRFRERLEAAACCRQCVAFCYDITDNKIWMLHVLPCWECKPTHECKCH